MRWFCSTAFLGLVLLFVRPSASGDLFSDCRFHFGTPADKASNNPALMAEVDYLTSWLGWSEDFTMGGFFRTCSSNGKTPVVIAYIIAYTARRDWSLQDCNVDPDNNLCKRGADYIRQQRARILSQYAKYGRGATSSFGSANPIVWCMEPDYVQYTDASQNGGGLTMDECGSLMSEILDSIKANCPTALFSMDISPWKDTTWQKKWFAALPMNKFTIIHSSDGISRPDQIYITPGWTTALPTWAWVTSTYNKPMLADAGYGVAGASTGHDTLWDKVENLTARINDGLLGVSQMNPNAGWASTIIAVRPQLPAPSRCPTAVVSPGQNVRRDQRPAPLLTAPGGTIRYTLFENASVRLRIYSLSGVRMKCIINEKQAAGSYSYALNRRTLGNGVYCIELSTDGSSVRRNVFIAK